ncbi:MAG: phosphatase PAP2 family protein [Flavobacteriales bacterium]
MTGHVFKLALGIWVAMVAVVFIHGISFSAIEGSALLSLTAIWITESGGKYGTLLILLVTCVFFTRFIEGGGKKFVTFILTLVKLIIVIGVFAYLNENLIKHALKQSRPSHLYVAERSQGEMSLQQLYALDNPGRHELLSKTIEENNALFAGINPHILSHWTEETGYSFPSGHSFNGFLLACILSFSLYNSRSKTGRKLYFLPLIWAASVAISRVALGAHTAWDVSFGALTGILIAFLLMHFNLLRDNLLHRKYRGVRG